MAKYIRRASNKPKKSKVIIALNVIIGLLVVLIIFVGIGYLNSGKDNYYNRQFGTSYGTHYDIEKEDYVGLLNDYYSDGGVIGRVNKGYEEAAALAQYADAALRRSAYENAGDRERAALQKQRMEKAASEVGIYEPEIAKIDRLLGR